MTFSAQDIRDVLADKIPEGRIVSEHTEDAHFYRDTSTNQLFASVTTRTGILDAPHLKKWAAKLAVEHFEERLPYYLEANDAEKADIKQAAVLAHKDLFEEAGDIGTQAHDIIENYLNAWIETGEQPTDITAFINGVTDTRVYAAIRSAEKFCNDFHVEPIASEMKVASNKHGYAGTLDALMLVGFEKKKGDIGCEHTMLCTSGSKQIYSCAHCPRTVQKKFCLVDWKTSNRITHKPEYHMQTAAYWYALKELSGIGPKHIVVVRIDKHRAHYEAIEIKDRVQAFAAFKGASKLYDWLTNFDKGGEENLQGKTVITLNKTP